MHNNAKIGKWATLYMINGILTLEGLIHITYNIVRIIIIIILI
jgi:hypothetical protein